MIDSKLEQKFADWLSITAHNYELDLARYERDTSRCQPWLGLLDECLEWLNAEGIIKI